MFTAKNYLVPTTLEEAWELNQSKSNKIVGGMLWLKMQHKTFSSLIDLSALKLEHIEESQEEFRIGAMCTLRELEEHQGIERFFNGVIRNSLEAIVGVQFRNLATVGGSIYSRFGFSDILTALMALDSYVELYKGGIISLQEYVNMPYDRDILVRIIVKKKICKSSYISFRNTATDFPVLACAVSQSKEGAWKIIYGARPGKALIFENNLPAEPDSTEIDGIIEELKAWKHFSSNMRGSEAYRAALAESLLRKSLKHIMEMSGAGAE